MNNYWNQSAIGPGRLSLPCHATIRLGPLLRADPGQTARCICFARLDACASIASSGTLRPRAHGRQSRRLARGDRRSARRRGAAPPRAGRRVAYLADGRGRRRRVSPLVALGIVIVIGLALRLRDLGTRSLWVDELFSVGLAAQHPSTILTVLYGEEANMALYYAFMFVWVRLVGADADEAWMRLPSVLFGVAGLWALYRLGSRLDRPATGLVAAALAAVNAYHIEMSQEARAYTMWALLRHPLLGRPDRRPGQRQATGLAPLRRLDHRRLLRPLLHPLRDRRPGRRRRDPLAGLRSGACSSPERRPRRRALHAVRAVLPGEQRRQPDPPRPPERPRRTCST